MSWFYWFTLLYFILFVFSTKTSACNNYSYQKYNQETRNNFFFLKTPVSKVCLSKFSQNKKKQKKKKQTKKKTKTSKHLQFRKKESHMFWHVDMCIVKKLCQTNAKHLNIFVSHKLETGQSA